MPYKNVLLFIATLFMFQLHATPCSDPAIANDDLSKKFRYGCFCGENYPDLKHPSKKSYRDLNSTESQELVDLYKETEPYDDIDKACQKHDICFISHRRKAKECNEAIYNKLNEIEDKFGAYSEDNVSNDQCKNLAFDIGSVFNTIFSPSDDDDSIFDFGMLMVNSGITVANKGMQETGDTFSDNDPRYPAKGVKCLLDSLGKPKTNAFTKVKVISIERNQNDKTKIEPTFTFDVSEISTP